VIDDIFYEIYSELSEQEEYKDFMGNFKSFYLTNHYDKNPIKKMERYLRDTGFQEYQVQLQDVFTFYRSFDDFIGIFEYPIHCNFF
jgi:hypothetical protein